MSNNGKCAPIDIPNFSPSWACCACKAKTGYSTANGNQRLECKACGYIRCEVPAVMKVAFETDAGITIVPVKTSSKSLN